MFDLVVQSGKLQGRRLCLPLDKPIIVGRDDSCQLVLPSSLVSRQHTKLCHRADGIEVQDLGSQNGTYVNEVSITEPLLLKAGDLLRIGASAFEIQTHQAPHTTPKAGPNNASTVEAKAMSGKPRSAAKGITDNDIADWLSDGDSAISEATSTSDTTVIRGRDVPSSHAIPVSTPAAQAVPKPVTPPKKFRSVKEEAADIIQRHWAKVRSQEAAADQETVRP